MKGRIITERSLSRSNTHLSGTHRKSRIPHGRKNMGQYLIPLPYITIKDWVIIHKIWMCYSDASSTCCKLFSMSWIDRLCLCHMYSPFKGQSGQSIMEKSFYDPIFSVWIRSLPQCFALPIILPSMVSFTFSQHQTKIIRWEIL